MTKADRHIVLIDDDPDVRDALKLMLEPLGYRLTCCSTGPQGLEAIRTSVPDLVLLDIMLASPSEGFHLAYELKLDDELATIPIIMISSIGETMGIDYARELGTDYIPAQRFLDKPLTAERVVRAIREVLGD
jgi:CheY-like chemotaxis protein